MAESSGASKTSQGGFPCTVDGCTDVLTSRFSLKRHLKKHTGERPYACTYEGCRKRFADSSTLRRHTRIHTGERPFKCEHCSQAFADPTNLRRHERTHTGVKPFRCPVEDCDRGFSRGNSLRQHMMTQHDLPKDSELIVTACRPQTSKPARTSRQLQDDSSTSGSRPNSKKRKKKSTSSEEEAKLQPAETETDSQEDVLEDDEEEQLDDDGAAPEEPLRNAVDPAPVFGEYRAPSPFARAPSSGSDSGSNTDSIHLSAAGRPIRAASFRARHLLASSSSFDNMSTLPKLPVRAPMLSSVSAPSLSSSTQSASRSSTASISLSNVSTAPGTPLQFTRRFLPMTFGTAASPVLHYGTASSPVISPLGVQHFGTSASPLLSSISTQPMLNDDLALIYNGYTPSTLSTTTPAPLVMPPAAPQVLQPAAAPQFAVASTGSSSTSLSFEQQLQQYQQYLQALLKTHQEREQQIQQQLQQGTPPSAVPLRTSPPRLVPSGSSALHYHAGYPVAATSPPSTSVPQQYAAWPQPVQLPPAPQLSQLPRRTSPVLPQRALSSMYPYSTPLAFPSAQVQGPPSPRSMGHLTIPNLAAGLPVPSLFATESSSYISVLHSHMVAFRPETLPSFSPAPIPSSHSYTSPFLSSASSHASAMLSHSSPPRVYNRLPRPLSTSPVFQAPHVWANTPSSAPTLLSVPSVQEELSFPDFLSPSKAA